MHFPVYHERPTGRRRRNDDRGPRAEYRITREIVALLRYSFFVGRDLKAIPESLLTKLYAERGDDYDRLITAVLGFVVSSSEFVAH
jgi:hypothetical protein